MRKRAVAVVVTGVVILASVYLLVAKRGSEGERIPRSTQNKQVILEETIGLLESLKSDGRAKELPTGHEMDIITILTPNGNILGHSQRNRVILGDLDLQKKETTAVVLLEDEKDGHYYARMFVTDEIKQDKGIFWDGRGHPLILLVVFVDSNQLPDNLLLTDFIKELAKRKILIYYGLEPPKVIPYLKRVPESPAKPQPPKHSFADRA